MKGMMKLIELCRQEWIYLRHVGYSQWDLEQHR